MEACFRAVLDRTVYVRVRARGASGFLGRRRIRLIAVRALVGKVRKFASSSPLVHLTPPSVRGCCFSLSEFLRCLYSTACFLLGLFLLRGHRLERACFGRPTAGGRSLVCRSGLSLRWSLFLFSFLAFFSSSLSAVFAAVWIIRSGARLLFPAACCAACSASASVNTAY